MNHDGMTHGSTEPGKWTMAVGMVMGPWRWGHGDGAWRSPRPSCHDGGGLQAEVFLLPDLMVPILALSPMIQMFLGVDWAFPGIPIFYSDFPPCFSCMAGSRF